MQSFRDFFELVGKAKKNDTYFPFLFYARALLRKSIRCVFQAMSLKSKFSFECCRNGTSALSERSIVCWIPGQILPSLDVLFTACDE